MISRTVSFKNTEDNINLTINDDTSGIWITGIEGIYTYNADVSTSDYSQTNGARYKNTRLPKRNIVVSGGIGETYHLYRQLLYRLFRPDSEGVFTYKEDDKDARLANYYAEKVSIDQQYDKSAFQASLICPDPFFYEKDPVTIRMSAWVSGFEFPHNFLEEGEELGRRSATRIDEIVNNNGVSGIGLTVTLKATGDVVNPYIYLYETGERLSVGTSENPYTLTSSASVIIETMGGKKGVTQRVSGIDTNINSYLDPDSVFFQLLAGVNTIGFGASTGTEYMDVTIQYRMRYLGV